MEVDTVSLLLKLLENATDVRTGKNAGINDNYSEADSKL